MADYYVRLDDIEKGFAVFCENVNLLYQQLSNRRKSKERCVSF